MNLKSRLLVFSAISILTLLVSLAFPIIAFADDGTPPPAATEEPALPPPDEAAEEVVPPENETTVAEVLEQLPEETEIVVLDEEGDPLPLVSEEAAEIIVTGDPTWCMDGYEPEDDPSGTNGYCTPPFTYFGNTTDGSGGLLEALYEGAYSGPGTIYVADNYDYTAESGNIIIDGSTLTGLAGSNLFVQGGWLFGTGGVGTNSNLGSLSFTIMNWGGDVSVYNLDMDGSDDGMYIQTTGDVDLYDLLVENTNSTGILIDSEGNVTVDGVEAYDNDYEGLYIEAAGDVDIQNSTFSGNGQEGYDTYDTFGDYTFYSDSGSSGLLIYSGGDVTLRDVVAESNGMDGASIFADGDVQVDDSVFNENGWYGYYTYTIFDDGDVYSETTEAGGGSGLYVEAEGDITLEDVTANDNAYYGAELYSDGDVSVYSSYFGDGDCDCDAEGNGGMGSLFYEINLGGPSDSSYDTSFYFDYHAGGGFIIDAEDDVTIEDVYAISNAGDGAEIESDDGDVDITDSVFAENGWSSGIFDCEDVDDCWGYEELYYGLDMYCETVGMEGFMTDPCGTEFEVYAPNLELELYTDSGDDYDSQEYYVEQYGGIGLYAESEEGDIHLENVGVYENSGTGADLDADEDIQIEESDFNANGLMDYSYYGEHMGVTYEDDYDHFSYIGGFAGGYSEGLVAYSQGDITLVEVYASSNGSSGAYLSASGDINVEDGVFNANGQAALCAFLLCDLTDEMPVSNFYVEYGYSSDYYSEEDLTTNEIFGLYGGVETGSGLDAGADGNITLSNVVATANGGNGAELYTDANASITESSFNANGDGLEGYLFLMAEVEASECPLCFEDFELVHLEGYMGNHSGLYVDAEGDVTLDEVEADSNALHGAELYSDATDSVVVTDSEFNGNGDGYSSWVYYDADEEEENSGEQYGSGLYVDSQGAVTLTNVEALGNYNNGAEIYSNNGPVVISCGEYSGNEEYGVYVNGASSLALNGPVLSGNGSGEYFFGGTVILDDCLIPETKDEKSTLIPVTGGGKITCEKITTDNVTVKLPNGDFVVLACPIHEYAVVDQVLKQTLPAPLGEDVDFVSALTALVMRDGQPVEELEEPMVVSFIIPEGMKDAELAILFWNGTEWIELEGSLSEDGLYFEVNTSLVGTFVLVQK